MSIRKQRSRFTLVLILFLALCVGTVSPRAEVVEAKPNQVQATNVVISEFRFIGSAGGTDEFVEIYNPTISSIDISGWWIRRSSNTGGTFDVVQIPTNSITTNFLPGQYYLIAATGYNDTVSADLTYTTTGFANDGGVALTLADKITVIDQAGLSSGSAYKEGTNQTSLTTSVDRGYERKLGGTSDSCLDDGNNSTDYQLINPSIPQNSSAPRRLCGFNSDLRLSQIVSNPTPAIGTNVDITVTITNDGNSAGTGVIVKDVLPAGLTYQTYTSSLGTYDFGTGIWTIGGLAIGSATLTITARVDTSGVKTNIAEVWASDQVDPDSLPANGALSEDDYSSISITPPLSGSADIGVSKNVNNTTPNVNDNIVFTITATNSGLDPATSLVIQDSLPAGLSYISHNASVGTYSNGTGAWSIGSLPVGSSATLQITVNVATIGSKTNTASVASLGQVDGNPANDSASVTITPSGGIADLSLTQLSPTKSTSIPGQLTFSLTVSNGGPYTANNVIVKDDLASGFAYVSDNSGGTYNKDTGLWNAGDIASLGSKTLTITVKVKSTGTFTNYAEVWSVLQVDPDSTPGNGSTIEDDDDTVTVNSADLSLTQTSSLGGVNAVFTIRVTNSGPNTANNVLVSNSKLHTSSYTYVSHSVSAGSYDKTTGIWNIGSLANGTTVTLIVTTTWNSLDENLAQVSKSDEVDIDSVPDNSSGVEDDEATTPTADLSLTQLIISPTTNPDINSNITFRITVFNAGNANATNVKVKDLLPAGLTYVSHTSGQTYDKTTGIWSVGSLLRNESKFLDITAQVASYGVRTNYAEISFVDQRDPDSDPGDGSTNEDDDDSVTFATQRAVIINEIAWAGTAASAEDEWLELYNPSDTTITIAGWTIRKNSCLDPVYITLESGKSISKDGYFLLERGSTSTDNTTVSDVSASQIYLTTVPALLDTGEILYLCDTSGNSVDTANANGGSWPAGDSTSPYGSMERQGTSAEQDSAWVTNRGGTRNGLNATGGSIYGTPGKKNSIGNSSPVSTITPEPTNTPTPPPGPVQVDPRPIINEILARPGFDWNQDGRADVFDEFIEIKNLTSIDISLSGWRLDKVVPSGEPAKSFSLPAVTLKPGERVVFYSKQTNLLLSDGGETVRLINASGRIYDAFTYNLARAEDKSFCRLPDGNPGESWFEDCIPTPNLTNTREGKVPSSIEGESPVCNLPDTIPLDFFIPECNGYGADIWNPYYWNQLSGVFRKWIQDDESRWNTFIE